MRSGGGGGGSGTAFLEILAMKVQGHSTEIEMNLPTLSLPQELCSSLMHSLKDACIWVGTCCKGTFSILISQITNQLN